MSDGSKNLNGRTGELIQKGRGLPPAPDRVRLREGYAMPAQPASQGPVSARPGSALPPKAAK